MEYLLEIKDYSFSLAKDGNFLKLLENISFGIYPNEIVGLLGASGSGKSMTAKCIMRLHQGFRQLQESGSIYLKIGDKEIDLTLKHAYQLAAQHIGFIFQQSANVLNPTQTIEKQLLEKLNLGSGYSRVQSNKELQNLLEEVELNPAQDFLHRYPHQLSGGQLQRVLIALALINQPRLIIADEPLSALDTKTQEGILNLLTRINQKYQTAIILISHDLAVVKQVCSRLIFIEQGVIIEQGPTEAIFSQPKTALVQQHVSSLIVREEQKQLSLEDREILFEIAGLKKSYSSKGIFSVKTKKDNEVFSGLNMKIYKGELLGLEGVSGSGKSTIARMLLRLEPYREGTIHYKSQNIATFAKAALKQFRLECQIIFQDAFSALSPHRTVRDHFNDAAVAMSRSLEENRLHQYLDVVNLESSQLDKLPNELSGGQRQRVLIARALYMNTQFLVCDEILSSLDALVANSILDLLMKLVNESQLTILFISHDKVVLEKICNRIISLD